MIQWRPLYNIFCSNCRAYFQWENLQFFDKGKKETAIKQQSVMKPAIEWLLIQLIQAVAKYFWFSLGCCGGAPRANSCAPFIAAFEADVDGWK